MANRTCTATDCDKPPRTAGSDLCPMHYHRMYRHGSLDKTASGVRVGSPRRYRVIVAKGHPLAYSGGRAYEHRVVLYDQIGPGPHECHWCGKSVDWLPKGDQAELQPDHLNNDGGDNRPENLVPACRACNAARGNQRRAAVLRERGWWSVNDTIAALKSGGRKPAIEEPRAG